MQNQLCRLAFIAAAVLGVAATTSRGGAVIEEPFTLSEAPAATSPAPAPASPEPFDKGSWVVFTQAMYHFDVEREDTNVGTLSAGFGYYFKDNWSCNFQLVAYNLQQEEQPDRFAGGFDLLLRNHFVNRDPWTVFIDGGAGVLWGDGHFPAGGTHQNFSMQAGFGLTYRLTDSMHLMGAAKWFHVSNARKRGRERNPHTDGIGFFVGLMWTR